MKEHIIIFEGKFYSIFQTTANNTSKYNTDGLDLDKFHAFLPFLTFRELLNIINE